jgi:competence ComEA-like helix-hairpin-helix protein
MDLPSILCVMAGCMKAEKNALFMNSKSQNPIERRFPVNLIRRSYFLFALLCMFGITTVTVSQAPAQTTADTTAKHKSNAIKAKPKSASTTKTTTKAKVKAAPKTAAKKTTTKKAPAKKSTIKVKSNPPADSAAVVKTDVKPAVEDTTAPSLWDKATENITKVQKGVSDIKTLSLPAGGLNINTASVDDLKALPGIGDALAAKIVEYRTIHGTITSLADLRNVDGIGSDLLDKLAGLIKFQ